MKIGQVAHFERYYYYFKNSNDNRSLLIYLKAGFWIYLKSLLTNLKIYLLTYLKVFCLI